MLNVSTQRVRLKPNLQVHGVGPADMTFLQFRLVEVQCSVVRLRGAKTTGRQRRTSRPLQSRKSCACHAK